LRPVQVQGFVELLLETQAQDFGLLLDQVGELDLISL